MVRTVRTSQTVWRSAEGFDDPSREGERKRFDEFPIMLDIDRPVMLSTYHRRVFIKYEEKVIKTFPFPFVRKVVDPIA
jgi:hypothetical protein